MPDSRFRIPDDSGGWQSEWEPGLIGLPTKHLGARLRYQRFEDLPVWNDAIELAVRLLRISQTGRLNGLGDLKNQLERAAISISNNIAEGFERGTNQELVTFLYYARGSAGEVRSMLHLLARLCPDRGTCAAYR